MRVRILLSLAVVLVSSVGVAEAAAAPKPKASATSEQLCVSNNGSFSTKASASFFRPFFKKQGVVWSCNDYDGGSATTQLLEQSCSSDGGQAWTFQDGPPGEFTCWRYPPQ